MPNTHLSLVNTAKSVLDYAVFVNVGIGNFVRCARLRRNVDCTAKKVFGFIEIFAVVVNAAKYIALFHLAAKLALHYDADGKVNRLSLLHATAAKKRNRAADVGSDHVRNVAVARRNHRVVDYAERKQFGVKNVIFDWNNS